eukprot:11516635-Alexandrium_andersonii.AAC.1
MEHVHGEPWAQEPSDPNALFPYRLITFKTISESVYQARAFHSDNAYAQATIQAGLPKVTVFNRRMPDKVTPWLRDIHNSFHEGSKYGFMEL